MVKPLLVKAVNLVKGKALDIGACQGVDSLFLAEKGFEVTAIEKDENLFKEIESMNIGKIRVVNKNILDFDFSRYDLVNCCFVLHFLKEKARDIILKIQENTNVNGINVIITFLDEGDFDNIHEGFFKSEERKELYADWEILVYGEKEVKTKEVNNDGSPKMQKAAFLLARKK